MGMLLVAAIGAQAAPKSKVIKITVEPKEAAIYINNTMAGYGYAEFTRPKKKNDVVIIRCECSEYKPISTKFYGGDKRNSLSFALQQDGFYRLSAASGIVNKFFTIFFNGLIFPTLHIVALNLRHNNFIVVNQIPKGVLLTHTIHYFPPILPVSTYFNISFNSDSYFS